MKFQAICGFFLFLLVSLNSCVKEEDLDNVILDPKGIVIKLEWTNKINPPTKGADFDLFVSKDNGISILSSTSSGGFEEIIIENGDLANGTYDIEVLVDDINTPTNYTVTIQGIESKKAYALKYVDVKVSDRNVYLDPGSIVVNTNKYTVLQ